MTFQTVTISRRETRRLQNIDFFVFWKSLPNRRIEQLRYSCVFKSAMKAEPFVRLKRENQELRKMNLLLRQELDQVKEKNRCMSSNGKSGKVLHPINVPADASNEAKVCQKNLSLSFRKLFGCAISFGCGKVRKKQSNV